MDSGFSYGDIIVIGAIAVFILLRYRAMLGETGERDEMPRQNPASTQEYERVILLPSGRSTAQPEKKDEEMGKKYGSLAENFVAMRGIDREFSPEEFIQGARAAYEMVIEAFSKGNRDTLKLLLSETLYKQFDASLTAAEGKGERDDTTLAAITKSEFASAQLKGNLATIAVDFVSEQIHLVRDASGAIIEGNPSHAAPVEDRWVFTRNLTSSDPNWKIIET